MRGSPARAHAAAGFIRARCRRRRVLTLLLADAEVELMPRELRAHPRVLARAKRRRRAPEHLLLDQASDHEAMRALPDAQRRGRPDIVHACMLLALDSPLWRRGALRVLVHTRDNALIVPRADLRLPRSQALFYQLLEDLLRQGEVPLGNPLLTLQRDRTLRDALRETGGDARVLLDEAGELARTGDFTALARESEGVTVVLGAFPRGPFEGVGADDVDHVLRVADEPLSAWSALVPVLAGFEDALL